MILLRFLNVLLNKFILNLWNFNLIENVQVFNILIQLIH